MTVTIHHLSNVYHSYLTPFHIESGGERKKVNELASVISAQWKAMSPEEQLAATDDLINVLEDQREMKALSMRNVPIEAFRDADQTLVSIEHEVSHFSDGYTKNIQ